MFLITLPSVLHFTEKYCFTCRWLIHASHKLSHLPLARSFSGGDFVVDDKGRVHPGVADALDRAVVGVLLLLLGIPLGDLLVFYSVVT